MHFSPIPDDIDLQTEPRTFILLPKDQGNRQYGFIPLDLRVMVGTRDSQLSDQSHQEYLHPEAAIR